MADIKIRKCVKEDVIGVFQLIKELALYENLGDQVRIDHTTLLRDGFDTPSPAFRCLVAERTDNLTKQSQIVGYAFFYNSYSTWLGKSIFMDDLYVKQEFRKCGAGKDLFLGVAKIAEELSCRMDFNVLAWNKPSIEFYKSFGAICLTETEEWNLYRLSDDALKKAVKHN